MKRKKLVGCEHQLRESLKVLLDPWQTKNCYICESVARSYIRFYRCVDEEVGRVWPARARPRKCRCSRCFVNCSIIARKLPRFIYMRRSELLHCSKLEGIAGKELLKPAWLGYRNYKWYRRELIWGFIGKGSIWIQKLEGFIEKGLILIQELVVS